MVQNVNNYTGLQKQQQQRPLDKFQINSEIAARKSSAQDERWKYDTFHEYWMELHHLSQERTKIALYEYS